MSTLAIRKACDTDYSSICSLINNELGYPNVNITSLSARMEKMKKSENYYIFVATLDNRVVAFLGAVSGMAFELDEDYFRIIGLAVSSAHQGKGIGRALLKFTEEFAQSKNCSVFALSSGFKRLKAHEFYEHNGYVKNSYSFSKTIK